MNLKIQVYVAGSVSPEQQSLAGELRSRSCKVHFALDKPFNRVAVCDAYMYDGDNADIAKAYEAAGVPVFTMAMIDGEVVEPVVEVVETPEPPKEIKPKAKGKKKPKQDETESEQ